MRWASPKPREGEIRRRIRFAWLPTRVDGGLVVWWEWYIHAEWYMWAVNAPTRWRTLHRLPTYGLSLRVVRAVVRITPEPQP